MAETLALIGTAVPDTIQPRQPPRRVAAAIRPSADDHASMGTMRANRAGADVAEPHTH
jgi:hypothetical protein